MKNLDRNLDRRGLALPLVILALIVAAGFVIVSSTMNKGLREQLMQSDSRHFSFILASSALARVLGKIQADSWDNRPFKTRPMTEYNVAFNGGTYDLWVENTPRGNFQADIYIRTNLDRTSRLYFWRIRFLDDLLDVSNRILIECFRTGQPEDFPTGSGSPFAARIDDILRKRQENQKLTDTTAASLQGVNNPEKILTVLSGRPMDVFPEKYPLASDGPEALIKQREGNPIPPPAFAGPSSPPPSSAPPTTPPAVPPTTPPVTPDPAAMEKVRNLTDPVLQAATDLKASIDGLVAVYEPFGSNMAVQMPAAQKFSQDLPKLLEQMSKVMGGYSGVVQGLPTPEAAKAAKDLIANTVISGLQTFAETVGKYESGVFRKGTESLSDNLFSTLDQKLAQYKSVRQSFAGMIDGQVKTLADQLGPLAVDPAIQDALTRTMNDIMKVLDMMGEDLDKAAQVVASRKAAGK